MREPEMDVIADLISRVLTAPDDDRVQGMVRAEVRLLCKKFPLYPDRQA
jgi:glycine/serine hydroxymethyltransferase